MVVLNPSMHNFLSEIIKHAEEDSNLKLTPPKPTKEVTGPKMDHSVSRAAVDGSRVNVNEGVTNGRELNCPVTAFFIAVGPAVL